MTWVNMQSLRLSKPDRKRLLGKTSFYTEQNVDRTLVRVLRRAGYDVESAQDIGAESQPDTFHYKRAFKNDRVLITHDVDFLDGRRFPLSQTSGVVVLNVDPVNDFELARALVVIEDFLGGIGPTLRKTKLRLNSDCTATWIHRVYEDGQPAEFHVRVRFDRGGRTLWLWEPA